MMLRHLHVNAILVCISIIIESSRRDAPVRTPMQARRCLRFTGRQSCSKTIPRRLCRARRKELFRQNCAKCHTESGTGSRKEGRVPGIPDFTKAAWQDRRTDEQLEESILDGKGADMPPHRGEISKEQGGAWWPTFAPFGKTKGQQPAQETKKGPVLAEFDKRYHRLQDEQDKLKRQFHEHSDAAANGVSPKHTRTGQPEIAQQPSPAAPGSAAIRELFSEHCAECHGAKGTGSAVRRRQPDIPDFTNTSWQARRTDGAAHGEHHGR